MIDKGGILRYQGAFDDTNFRQRTSTRDYLEEALKAVMIGKKPENSETILYGCAIVRYRP